jgi:hypothetical protein
VSGAPVAVSDKDRSFVPVGVSTSVTKESGDEKALSTQGSTTASNGEIGTVTVNTVPDGADVYADEQFVGNAPATLKLKPGKHTIRAKMAGYSDWSREISSDPGSEAHLTANLEKSK